MARGLVIAAPSSGAGKTLITLGLLRAFRKSGTDITSAKTGPDYIDPRFHEAASGHPCVNLDCWAMRPELVRALAERQAGKADMVLIEGVMGLFDGAVGGGGSTSDLASMLALPVILIVDAQKQGQSAAALVKGFAEYREDCDIAGVILNRVATRTHGDLLAEAISELEIPVLGAVPLTRGIELPSRHLGLVQAGEHRELEAFIEQAAEIMGAAIDMDRLSSLSATLDTKHGTPPSLAPLGQRMAIAQDEAFGFTYPHLLDGWHDAGAEILPFSPLADEAPDKTADAVYLPGGYPELHAGRLAANENFLSGLRDAAARNALVYGECGGFMVLGDALVDADSNAHAMAGLLPVTTSFAERGLKLGYRILNHISPLPWPSLLRGHEFHYSTLVTQGEGEQLFEASDSRGEGLGPMGLRRDTVMGSYAHVIDCASAP